MILVLALIIFGPGKLPDVGKALGRSIGEFKKATKEAQDAVKLDEAESAKASRARPTKRPIVWQRQNLSNAGFRPRWSCAAGYAAVASVIVAGLQDGSCAISWNWHLSVLAAHLSVARRDADYLLSTALGIGVVVASPVVIYQIWGIHLPGLVR